MPRVLLLATTTGYQTRSFGEAAEHVGVELVFATDRCDKIDDPWRDAAIPIRFYDEERSVAAVIDALRARPVDGVLVVGDRPTVIAAHVQRALGFPGNPPDAATAARNKLLARERYRDAGLAVPWFRAFSIATHQPPAPVSFPCVVKPVGLSGSRGVIRVDDPASLAAAVGRVRALLASPDIRAERDEIHTTALLEEFIPGREYAVEGLLQHGRLHVLAIFDKPDPLDGPFFEETIYVTPSLAPAPVQRAIEGVINDAVRALGLRHGPIHAECRVNDRGVYILEVAARPIGGLCARALHFQSTLSNQQLRVPLEQLLLRHALGEDPAAWRREDSASGVMMIPIPKRGILRGVSGIDAARAVAHVDDVRITAKVDQKLVPLPEAASYLGFIFARGETPGIVEAALRDAHRQLIFHIDPELPVLTAPQTRYNHGHG